MKDNYKTFEYYQKEIDRCNYNLKRFKDKMVEVRDIPRLYIAVSRFLYYKISLMYILDSNILETKACVEEYIMNMKTLCQIDNKPLTYNQIESTLSLAYLFDLDVTSVEFVKDYMLPEKYVDACLDIIRNIIFTGVAKTDKTFYFKDKGIFGDYDKCEGGILDVINSPKSQQTLLFVKFLKEIKEKHYKRVLKAYEKLSEEQYTYIGSFDFRLTAVAKALELDKEQLEGSMFIAVDLL